MGVLPVKAETRPHSAVHSLILPEVLGLHLTPFTPPPPRVFTVPKSSSKPVSFAVESLSQWHPTIAGDFDN